MAEMHLEVELFYESWRFLKISKSDYEEAQRIIKRQIKAELGLEVRVVLVEENLGGAAAQEEKRE